MPPDMTFSIRRDVQVAMSDGVTLRADVYVPTTPDPVPTLLQRLPYDKSASLMAQHIVGLEVVRALDAGFAVVIQDTRGRYSSDGEFDAFVHEARDGADTIAWVRDQAFSDGQVFMYGASYIGATQLLVAATRPEGLRGIAPQLTTSDYREGWTYRGGALQLGFVLLWIIESLAGPDLLRRPASDRVASQQLLDELMEDPLAAMERLPLLDEAMADLAPYFATWLSHPAADEFWGSISPHASAGEMDVAGLHIGGWNDIFVDGTVKSYLGMRQGAATVEARESQYLVVGPWSHGNMSDWQGVNWHGYSSHAGAVDLTALHLEFFSAIAQGRAPDLPRVQIFTTGVDEWRTHEDWPIPHTVKQEWYVGSGGSGGHELTQAPPETSSHHEFVADPSSPVPTVGGATFLPGLMLAKNSGPHDQRSVEERDDVLVYSSAPLAEDLEVTGEVLLELWASSSATDCDWTARLADVHDDGTSVGIVDGILRSRYRTEGEPTPLEPGRRERFEVVLGNTSHVFRAGHRLRLQIASSNFPRFDRNPQCMKSPVDVTADDFVMAEQRVFYGADQPTRLIVPVIPRRTSDS